MARRADIRGSKRVTGVLNESDTLAICNGRERGHVEEIDEVRVMAELGIQPYRVGLHGGDGVRNGEAVERLYREIRALRIYEGASDVQRVVIARQTLGAMS